MKVTGVGHGADLDVKGVLSQDVTTLVSVGPNQFDNQFGLYRFAPQTGVGVPLADSSNTAKIKYMQTYDPRIAWGHPTISPTGILQLANFVTNVFLIESSEAGKTIKSIDALRHQWGYKDITLVCNTNLAIEENGNIGTPTGGTISLPIGSRVVLKHFANRWQVVSVTYNYTPANPALNLSDLTNLTQARTNLQLKTMALQDASNVTITGGNASLSAATVTGSLTMPNGSSTAPGLHFANSPTGMYMGTNGETAFRGPVANSASSFLFSTTGNNVLTLDAGGGGSASVDNYYSQISFSKGGARQWSITNGNGKDLYIAYPGLSFVPFALTNTGAVSLSGPSISLNGPTALTSGVSYAYAEKDANYTLTDNDYTVTCNATPASFTITAPASGPRKGRVYVIKKGDATGNTITIKAQSGELIENSNTYTLSALNQTITIQSNGNGAWTIIGKVN